MPVQGQSFLSEQVDSVVRMCYCYFSVEFKWLVLNNGVKGAIDRRDVYHNKLAFERMC